MQNDPLRMAGATAFFATFALPAVLIILIQVFGLFFSPRYMSQQLFESLSDVIGTNTAAELHKTLLNVHHLTRGWLLASAIFIFLIFVATTLFKVIKGSLNQLWNIKVEEHAGIAFNLLSRAKSFIAIMIAGILFLAVLLGEALTDLLNHSIHGSLRGDFSWPILILKQIISIIIVTVWFTMVFKFLPNGKPSWKIAITGALFTGILFTLGKIFLQWLLSYSNMQTIYGASTSFVLLLLFIFYSSFIFYYGACFTKIWAEYNHASIEPGKHAIKYELSQIEKKRGR